VILALLYDMFLFMAQQPPWTRASPFRSFTITLRHITLGRTPLDEWSARRTDLYLTRENKQKRQPGSSGIRTRNASKRAAADPGLRPSGQWDRLWSTQHGRKGVLRWKHV